MTTLSDAYARSHAVEREVRERKEKAARDMSTQELADALDHVSPSQAATVAARYAAMKAHKYVTADGDVLDPKDYDSELEHHRQVLMRYVEKNGPLPIEGVGTFRIQDRASATTWDVKALAENDPLTFARLLELGCVTLNTKLANEQAKAGAVTMFQQYGHAGSTKAMVIDRE